MCTNLFDLVVSNYAPRPVCNASNTETKLKEVSRAEGFGTPTTSGALPGMGKPLRLTVWKARW